MNFPLNRYPAYNITSIALKSSGTRAQKHNNKIVNHIQKREEKRGHQFKGPPTIFKRWKSEFEIFTERVETFTRFLCSWELVPNAGCSNRESTLAQVQFCSGNRNITCCEVDDLSCLGMLTKCRRLAR